MKLQTKLLSSILAVGLTVALVGGSTMAWFTDTKTVTPPTFTAGTVTLNDVNQSVTLDTGFNKDNLNPGDTIGGHFDIINTGSKAVRIRVQIPTFYWNNPATQAHTAVSNFSGFTFTDPSKWYYSNGYMYYKDVVLGTLADGTFAAAANEAARTITVTASATISGALTGNAYQGQQLFVSNFLIESIQATNDADSSSNWAPLPVAVS